MTFLTGKFLTLLLTYTLPKRWMLHVADLL
jgi:hypothetical protein